jgi:aspartyl-tRNA(Asn)/glutamyl-tRNA(Gln) amidotransferase subunit A
MDDLIQHSLAELSVLLSSRQISSRELTEVYLARIEQLDPALNSFITVCPEIALQQADRADTLLAQGAASPITGIPQGIRTTCGSRMLADFVSPYDATVVERLAEAGAVLIGKTNMDEFAMGSSNETSYFGPVKNPWDLTRVSGGSSGGSAAAVAARLVPAATGTDTGGSIRQPAAFCGITGIKPTYGAVSRFGMVAYASSLDQGGAMAQSAEDTALLLDAMTGFDPRDSTSIDRDQENLASQLSGGVDGLKIGIPKEYFSDDLDKNVAQKIHDGLDCIQRLGAELVELSLPNSSLAIPAYYVIAPAECSSNLSRYDGIRFGYRCDDARDIHELYCRSRAEGFGDEVKRRIMVGTYALSTGYYDAYYLKAQRIRRLIRDDFLTAFETVDVIAGPTSPSTAFAIGEKTDDPITMYLSDIYTIAVNLAGLPAISIPVGQLGNLPIGLQLISGHFREATILNLAHCYQQVTDWHKNMPNMEAA